MDTKFKVGDKVKPKAEELESVIGFAGESPDGTYTVTSVSGSDYVRVKSFLKFVRQNGESLTIRDNRFVKVSERMEGTEVQPIDIRVGDEILVTRTGSDGITHTRQAVVGNIEERNDRYGKTLSFQSVIRGGKINWGQDFTETFTLIKSAPKRDLLLERLTAADKGQVITFREVLARKQVKENWDVFVTGALTDSATVDLRGLIGESEVLWMKPEKTWMKA